MLRHLDLFSGIGGFALAARMVGGYETVGFCEIDPYCQAVLRRRWPGVPVYDDVRELRADELGRIDIATGGFPCQDISLAGKGAGIDGERSGLWGEYARLIGELRPSYALVENVPALTVRGLGRVLGDLAELGYDAEWRCLSAAAIGARHLRNRIWIVAYPAGASVGAGLRQPDAAQQRHQPRDSGGALADAGRPRLAIGELLARISGGTRRADAGEDVAVGGEKPGRSLGGRRENQGRTWAPVGDAIGLRQLQPQGSEPDERGWLGDTGWWSTEPDVGRVAHGIPARVDRLRGLGNAIVPQVAAIFLQAIKECHDAESGTVPCPRTGQIEQ